MKGALSYYIQRNLWTMGLSKFKNKYDNGVSIISNKIYASKLLLNKEWSEAATFFLLTL